MTVNIDNLMTVTNYANLKELSRQHVYRLVQNNELTLIEIDGIKFILLDEKAVDFIKKRN
jgi:collagenase-like PrtC family protease